MKAAVSIPDSIFEQGERLARRLRTTRSRLYANALADYVAQHDEDNITAAMNKTLAQVGEEEQIYSKKAARQILRQVEW
jgi:predicted transcriptional regulator